MTRTAEAANRWVVPGSRLFSHGPVRLMLGRIAPGWRTTRQSGSPPDVGALHGVAPLLFPEQPRRIGMQGAADGAGDRQDAGDKERCHNRQKDEWVLS